MTDRRIGLEKLPPLPDDLEDAALAKSQAESRVAAVQSRAPEVYSLVDILSSMYQHNGFGPLLEQAWQNRNAS